MRAWDAHDEWIRRKLLRCESKLKYWQSEKSRWIESAKRTGTAMKQPPAHKVIQLDMFAG